jgi:hypothetical protein
MSLLSLAARLNCKEKICEVRFQVLAVVSMKMAVFLVAE